MTDGSSVQFSLVGFAVALATVGVGTATGLAFVPVVGSYLGMLAGGLAAGLVTEDRLLLEGGIAGVLASLGIVVAGGAIGNGVGTGLSALGSIAPTTLLVSVVLSFAVGAFGAHFGSDIRHGITEPVETPPSGSTEMRVPIPSAEDERSREEIRGDETGASERAEETRNPSNVAEESTARESGETDLELERE